METLPDSQILLELANTSMPFGKYQGRVLMDLPEPYLVWFHQQGFPKGKLGEQLQLLYEIKLNGLEGLLKPLRRQYDN
jgi:uncharacterized protein